MNPTSDFATEAMEAIASALIREKQRRQIAQEQPMFKADLIAIGIPIIRSLHAGWRPPLPKRDPGEPKSPRKRDLLFDALAEAFGQKDKPITPSYAALLNKVKCEIVAVDPSVTPDIMKTVALAVRRKYDGATPKAVALHWHEHAPSARRTQTAIRYDVNTEPSNWHELAKKAFPGSWAQVVALEWAMLPRDLRADILKYI